MQDFNERMRLFYDNPVISWHEHVQESAPGELDVEHCDNYIASMDKVGMDKAMFSIPLPADPHCPPEDFTRVNNVVYQAMKRHPKRIYGQAFVNPGYIKQAIYEVERCIKELGMVGIKLYHQYFIDDPALNDLIDACAKMDIPILMHAGKGTDPDTIGRQPRISNGVHFARAGAAHPDATFIMGHIGGGGDWQWSLKALEHASNVLMDMSGSVYDCPIIEESVRYIGADRILFATDCSFSSCVGKMLGATISDEDKKKILAGVGAKRFIERVDK